jgi:hypothetical protein
MNDNKFQREVCERDEYVCQICFKNFSAGCYFQGEVNQYVCAHHIKTKKAHPELRHDLENGICICSSCHNKIHMGLIKLDR